MSSWDSSGKESDMGRLRIVLVVVLFVLFIAGIVYGVSLGDVAECELHGSNICLSCMGIE